MCVYGESSAGWSLEFLVLPWLGRTGALVGGMSAANHAYPAPCRGAVRDLLG